MRAFCALGEVARIRGIGPTSWYLISHPAGVEQVLARNAAGYRAPTSNLAASLFGRGLIAAESDSWLARSLASPVLDTQRLTTVLAATVEAAEEVADGWELAIRDGRAVDMVDEMRRLTLRATSASALSLGAGPESDAFGRSLLDALRILDRRPTELSAPGIASTRRNWRALQARGVLDHLLLELIRNRRDSGRSRPDLLGALIRTRAAGSGERLDDARLRAELFALLLAGSDTAATILAWSWELLARHGDVLRALQTEADEVLGLRAVTPDDLARLPYARAVVDETLRLYPPSWGLPREAVVPDEIAGYRIPAGALIVLCRWVTHRRAEIWDDPARFDPTRFLGEAPPRTPFAYYPFGGAARGVAAELAATIAQATLATLARDFDVTSAAEGNVEPEASFTLRPRSPLRLHVARRFAAATDADDSVGQAVFLPEPEFVCVTA